MQANLTVSKAFRNRTEIAASQKAGCYFCKNIFLPAEITDYTDEGETALCPKCGNDTVLPSASCEITPEFLKEVSLYWTGK